jgi:hypothetical protein
LACLALRVADTAAAYRHTVADWQTTGTKEVGERDTGARITQALKGQSRAAGPRWIFAARDDRRTMDPRTVGLFVSVAGALVMSVALLLVAGGSVSDGLDRRLGERGKRN